MLEAVRFKLSAAGAVVQRDVAIFLTYRMRSITMLLGIVFSVTLFYYVSRLVQVKDVPTPGDYFAFVVVGLIIAQVLQSTLVLVAALRSELDRRDVRADHHVALRCRRRRALDDGVSVLPSAWSWGARR